jgi:hypothetical protein
LIISLTDARVRTITLKASYTYWYLWKNWVSGVFAEMDDCGDLEAW